jgi:hypothetical protein
MAFWIKKAFVGFYEWFLSIQGIRTENLTRIHDLLESLAGNNPEHSLHRLMYSHLNWVDFYIIAFTLQWLDQNSPEITSSALYQTPQHVGKHNLGKYQRIKSRLPPLAWTALQPRALLEIMSQEASEMGYSLDKWWAYVGPR